MKLYWRYLSVPELQGLSPDHQSYLMARGERASYRIPMMWVANGLLWSMHLIGCLPILVSTFPDDILVNVGWIFGWMLGGSVLRRLIAISAMRPVLARYRRSMESEPSKDGSYYVPPAF